MESRVIYTILRMRKLARVILRVVMDLIFSCQRRGRESKQACFERAAGNGEDTKECAGGDPSPVVISIRSGVVGIM